MKTWRRVGSEGGFTLVEIMVGMVLITIGILAMAALAVAVIGANRGATNRTRADQVLHEKVEEFRSIDYDDIVTGTDTVDMAGVEIVRTWTTTDDVPMDDIKKIELVGKWMDEGDTLSMRTATYVGKY